MRLYATSTNINLPAKNVRLLYLGPNLKMAEEAVGTFENHSKEEHQFPIGTTAKLCSALPYELDREMVQFFLLGNHWVSIEMFEIDDTSQ